MADNEPATWFPPERGYPKPREDSWWPMADPPSIQK
jgi:hypothetical protein